MGKFLADQYAASTSEKDTALTFPRNFAPLPLRVGHAEGLALPCPLQPHSPVSAQRPHKPPRDHKQRAGAIPACAGLWR